MRAALTAITFAVPITLSTVSSSVMIPHDPNAIESDEIIQVYWDR